MDYLYFLRERTRFIRRFYTDAAVPFTERKRKIAVGEEPFIPSYGPEGDEPAFLEEWAEADDALDVLGQACVSMLSACLQLYIEEWIDELVRRAGPEQLARLGIGLPSDTAYKSVFKNQGWINGYRVYCSKLGVDWGQAPSDLALLEQIVLARHSVQHPTDITSIRAKQTTHDARKHARGFFVDDFEMAVFNRFRSQESVRPVRLNITHDKLLAAVDQVEEFCVWLNNQHPMRRR